MEDDNIFLLPEVQGAICHQMLANRIKELKHQCEGLVEHSKRIQRDCQQLRQDFEVIMGQQRAMQRDLVVVDTKVPSKIARGVR